MYLRDRAIVLKKEPFREHDRSYILYGKEHGLLQAVARGSSSRHSKQAGHLEPWNEIEVMIAKGRIFDKLAVAKSMDYPARKRNLACLAVLGGFGHLIVSLTRPGISDERIFSLLQELGGVCGSSADFSLERVRLLYSAAVLKLIDILGFAPKINFARNEVDGMDSSESIRGNDNTLTLLKFMRRFSLSDVARVTVPVAAIDEAAQFVEGACRETPLTAPPHAFVTLVKLLDISP